MIAQRTSAKADNGASGSKSVPVEPLSDVITERDSTKTVTDAEERVIDTSSPRLQRKDNNVTV